ncbi:hypothetical protein IMY05_006G0213600 [Salix suchowensis]|nr:hypothetical protein IMY05_006G0213600 [Salix suchowensis]
MRSSGRYTDSVAPWLMASFLLLFSVCCMLEITMKDYSFRGKTAVVCNPRCKDHFFSYTCTPLAGESLTDTRLAASLILARELQL